MKETTYLLLVIKSAVVIVEFSLFPLHFGLFELNPDNFLANFKAADRETVRLAFGITDCILNLKSVKFTPLLKL